MEFLTFFAQRLNVSPSEASKLLEQTLNNYRPTRDYSSKMLDLHERNGSAPNGSGACALSARGSS